MMMMMMMMNGVFSLVAFIGWLIIKINTTHALELLNEGTTKHTITFFFFFGFKMIYMRVYLLH